jgi:hypothetical protein
LCCTPALPCFLLLLINQIERCSFTANTKGQEENQPEAWSGWAQS